MILRQYTVVPATSKNRRPRVELELKCDICQKIFFKHQNIKILTSRTNHYCSDECFAEAIKRGGEVDLKRKKTCNQKYGVDYYIIKPDVLIETSKKNNTEQAKEKRKQTCLQRYGITCYLNTPEIQAKAIIASHTPEIKEKRKIANIATLMQRYGVTSTFQLPHVKILNKTKEARQKRYETMKRNGSLNRSLGEIEFVKLLTTTFPELEVQTNVHHHGFSIDVHIVNHDLYIQFDGVYWHGLNRPLSEIQKFRTKQDIGIYRKWTTDRKLDTFCTKNNLKLVRITDVEFESKDFSIEKWWNDTFKKLFP